MIRVTPLAYFLPPSHASVPAVFSSIITYLHFVELFSSFIDPVASQNHLL